ncbi:hypothetical protein HYFRA_00012858 [Hymenoscyphus fraxineus]|uniref:2EXR domain-containing protein n=1 Tax=Hymenoscyphus fraxineus TaxID=746836 RepID=A0A9N9PYV5_9HELO|nr:hypothetical protein HYFRA_00012858 [Hymenoscyphus fraxineus]
MNSKLKTHSEASHLLTALNHQPDSSLETMTSLLSSLPAPSTSRPQEPSLARHAALSTKKENTARRFKDSFTTPFPTTKNTANTKKLKSPRPLREFHLFTKLPLEIRQMIWRETFSSPRQLLLMTHVHGKHMKSNTRFGPCSDWFNSMVPPPTVYNVNHDGRDEVLAHYRQLLTSCGPNDPPRIQKSVLFNPKTDTMYLSWDDCIINPPPVSMCSEVFSPLFLERGMTLEKLGTAGLESVQTLVLGQKAEMQGDSTVDLSRCYPRYLELFTGLQELRLARSEFAAVGVSMRQLYQYAAFISQHFQHMKKNNPKVKIPLITFWEMEENPVWKEMQNRPKQDIPRHPSFSGWNSEARKQPLLFPIPFVDRFTFMPLD